VTLNAAPLKSLRRTGAILSCLLGFLLSGCTTSTDADGTPNPPRAAFTLKTPFKVKTLPFAFSVVKPNSQILSELQGNTILTFNMFHGAQYEYMGSNGISYLWYGNNDRALKGNYYITGEGVRSEICWIYGSGTYNPITRQSGAKPDCSNLSHYLSRIREMADGDVLKLSSGSVPFRGTGLNVSFGLAWSKIRENPRFAQ
jgi:hypothetical protein